MSEEEIRRQREEERRRRIELIALLALLYTNMEDEMLGVIAENLGTDDFDGDLDSWRMRHLAAAENVGRTVTRIAGSYAAAQEQVFSEAITGAAREEAARVDLAVGSAPVSSAASAAAASASVSVSAGSPAKTASRVSEYFRKQAKHDINTVNTVMRYKAKQGYVTAVNSAFFTAKESERIWKALGEGAFDVAAGRASLQSAVRSTIAKMSEDGIPAFIDKAGREWSPEAYVRMDIRTTAANTARQAQWERCKEQGINLIEVSSHAGARPLCAPYQGGIYSLDGSSGTVKDAAGREISYTPLSSTSYGQAAGLFGINCGHQSYPFKPGINFRRYYPLETEEEFAENSKRYAEFQKQRAMERSIRASKRECMMCDAAGDKDGFTKASQKLARRKQAYREYSKSVGLKQHGDRTQVYGFDRSVSAKAVWADRKATLKNSPAPLTSGGGSGTINSDKAFDFHPVSDKALNAEIKIEAFEDEKLNKAISAGMHDVLQTVQPLTPGTEACVTIDISSYSVSAPKIGGIGEGTINIPERNVPYVSIHNHASGETLSDDDLRKFVSHPNEIGAFVIGNNGNTYGVIKDSNFNWVKYQINTIDKNTEQVLDEVMNGETKYGISYHQRIFE